MSGKKSRNKGAAGEREVAILLKQVYPDCRRMYDQSHFGSNTPDVDAFELPFFVEVKRQEKENIRRAYEQALKATDGRPPLVVSRPNRKPWLATLELETLLWLLDLLQQSRLPSND